MIKQVDAVIFRTYGIEPETLTDGNWLNLYAEYQFTEKIKYETNVLAFKQALAEVLNQAFGNNNEQ